MDPVTGNVTMTAEEQRKREIWLTLEKEALGLTRPCGEAMIYDSNKGHYVPRTEESVKGQATRNAAVNSEKPLEKDLSQELKVEGGKSTEEDDYVEVDLDEGDYEKVGMDDAEIEEWEVI